MKTKRSDKHIVQLWIAVGLVLATASVALGSNWGSPSSCTEQDEYFYDESWHPCELIGTSGGGETCLYICDGIPASMYKYPNEEIG